MYKRNTPKAAEIKLQQRAARGRVIPPNAKVEDFLDTEDPPDEAPVAAKPRRQRDKAPLPDPAKSKARPKGGARSRGKPARKPETTARKR